MAAAGCKIEDGFYNAIMVARQMEQLLRAQLESYPAVALVGPRQSGKTTLAKSLGGLYFDIEQETDRLRVDLGWRALGDGLDLVILDEAQEWPELFLRLRGEIDRDRKRNGRFLFLGSVSPSLMTQVSESLAGRLSLLELTPLLHSELLDHPQRERHWLVGGYPDGGVLDGSGYPQWQADYLDLITQRDLPNWGMPARPGLTRRLVRMLAGAHGQEWNASQIGKSLGLSYHTVNHYVDFLESAFLIRRLPAYHANIRKRLVKRPKLYWRDSGLLHSLLNVSDGNALLDQPWVGASWEGYVIEQALAALRTTQRSAEAHYLRTSDQKEIDLLVETDSELWAIEAKLTTHPRMGSMARLDAIADLVGANKRFLICRTSETIEAGSRIVCDLDGFCRYVHS